MIWMCAADGSATLFNKRWLQFVGSTLQGALDAGWAGSVIRMMWRSARRRSARRGNPPRRSKRNTGCGERTENTAGCWTTARRNLIRGRLAGYVGVAIDITERKRAEDELRWLSKAVEQSPASVVITDLNGHIEYVNPKFERVTGYTLAEVKGRNPRILKSGETPAGGIS